MGETDHVGRLPWPEDLQDTVRRAVWGVSLCGVSVVGWVAALLSQAQASGGGSTSSS